MNLKPKVPRSKKGLADRVKDILTWGPEPEFPKDRVLTDLERDRFYTWHHYCTDRSDGLSWLYEYLEANDGRRYEAISRIKDRHIVDTFFWMARLFNLGYIVEPKTKKFFDKALDEVITRRHDDLDYEIDEEGNMIFADKPEVESPKAKRNSASLSKTIEDIDDWIHTCELYPEEVKDYSLYQFAIDEDMHKPSFSGALNHYALKLEELVEELEKFDEDTKHYLNDFGLDNATKSYDKKVYAAEKEWLTRRIEILADVVDDLSSHVDNVKKTRKPRKKKILSVEKRVSRVKYQKDSDEFKLVSIPPSKLLGAQELWLYNTRYNFLSVYRAASGDGLDIKGTTLLNYDEKRSYAKKLGRTPKAYLDQILSATKARMGRVMDDIKGGAQSINGRINENTLILKAL